ncbi:MAG: outer membrane beta-barrel protein [Pseudobdellovibrionaceae bacterium]
MKKLVLSLFAMLSFSSYAMADVDYGLEVGIRSQSGDFDSTTVTTSSQMGFQFGATAHIPISGAWNLRTGMLYTQRPLVLNQGGVQDKVSINYLDIPVALMYKFADYAGVFGGISLAMNLDKTADSGVVSGVTSPLMPILIGASFKFAPNLGAALYYESAGGQVAKIGSELSNYRAVGANLMITFD